jgi:hypothetical protein
MKILSKIKILLFSYLSRPASPFLLFLSHDRDLLFALGSAASPHHHVLALPFDILSRCYLLQLQTSKNIPPIFLSFPSVFLICSLLLSLSSNAKRDSSTTDSNK